MRGAPATAGVVLVGGRSSRMGRAKARLEWHGSTLLYRTAALLGRAVHGPVVVVRAAGQPLPDLPAGVEVAEDEVTGRGPIQGIVTGLGAIGDRAESAFVCSTDLPFLHPVFVGTVLAGLRDPAVELVLPVARGHRQPLAAGYRVGVAGRVADLLAGSGLRPRDLPEHLAAVLPDERALLAEPTLAAADPALDSLLNVNTPEEYAAARARPAPEVSVDGVGTVPAATLGAAAATAGVPLEDLVAATRGGRVLAALNGEPVTPDPWLPLVAGDRVTVRRVPGE